MSTFTKKRKTVKIKKEPEEENNKFGKFQNLFFKKPALLLEALNLRDNQFNNKKISWRISVTKKKVLTFSKDLFVILIAAFLLVLAVDIFLKKANLFMTGLSSIAQVISYQVPIIDKGTPKSAANFFVFYLIFNFPLIIWGFLKIGIRFTFYTLLFLLFQNLVNLLFDQSWFPVDLRKYDFLGFTEKNGIKSAFFVFLYAFFGGLFYGTSLGLMYKIGGSSGGTDFIASFISLRRNYSISKLLRVFNILLVLIAIFLDKILFRGKPISFDSLFNVYLNNLSVIFTIFFISVTGFVMNRIYPRFLLITLFIVTKRDYLLKDKIYEKNYQYGGNVWTVKGMYSDDKGYKMIMTTMSLLEYDLWKNHIKEIDPKAVLIVVSTKELIK